MISVGSCDGFVSFWLIFLSISLSLSFILSSSFPFHWWRNVECVYVWSEVCVYVWSVCGLVWSVCMCEVKCVCVKWSVCGLVWSVCVCGKWSEVCVCVCMCEVCVCVKWKWNVCVDLCEVWCVCTHMWDVWSVPWRFVWKCDLKWSVSVYMKVCVCVCVCVCYMSHEIYWLCIWADLVCIYTIMNDPPLFTESHF